MSNAHEAEARAVKAGKIAAVLARFGCTPDTVLTLDLEARRCAERAAQVNPASAATWDLVHRLVANAHGDRDPFAGLPGCGR